MTEREKLIEEINKLPILHPEVQNPDDVVVMLADFILADRKRTAEEAVNSYRHGESMQKLQEGTHEDR